MLSDMVPLRFVSPLSLNFFSNPFPANPFPHFQLFLFWFPLAPISNLRHLLHHCTNPPSNVSSIFHLFHLLSNLPSTFNYTSNTSTTYFTVFNPCLLYPVSKPSFKPQPFFYPFLKLYYRWTRAFNHTTLFS